MDTLSKSLPSVIDRHTLQNLSSGPSMPSSEKLAKVAIAVDRIFKGRPETRTENPDYLDGLTETLETLTDEELGWVSDPREGIQTVCKFLPNAADLFELIRKRREVRDKFKAFGAPWKLLPVEREPEPDEAERARRKAFVEATRRGTEFEVQAPVVKRDLVPATATDLASLKLTTPEAPASPQLIALLQQQGYFVPRHNSEAA